MIRMLRFCLVYGLLLPGFSSLSAQTRLLRYPDISKDHVVFAYGNDLWVVTHEGEALRRITSFPGQESAPHFSPDGQQIAFSGEYDGNVDVFVVSVNGGSPKRLTWHPGPDYVRGWAPDGQSVLFASGRANAPYPTPDQFWLVSLQGEMPVRLPIPRISEGSYSPDGQFLAYQMVAPWDEEWRNYRGGQAQPIRVIDLNTLAQEKLPWDHSNDKNPVWIGEYIYFLSDRDLAMNVWAYHPNSKELKQLTHFTEFDCKQLEAGAGKLCFENGGLIYLLDPTSGKPARQLPIEVKGDFPWVRPHWADFSKQIQSVQLSPNGKRALFSARGEIFTVPSEKGDIRNLSRSPGIADREAAWSPDGKWISWFSDAEGEYALVIADQMGQLEKRIELPNPSFYYTPAWSPDSRYLSFGDAHRNLWLVEVASGTVQKIGNEGFAPPERNLYPEWAPDSRWIAYTRRLPSEFNAIFVYSLDQKKHFQISDGMSNCRAPAWDKNGLYLYFLASTNYGLNVGWLDMSSIRRPREAGVYVAVLTKDAPSPLAPESDEENGKAAEPEGEKKAPETDTLPSVRIDLEGIQHRILALPIPVRNYTELKAGAKGQLYFTESLSPQNGFTLHHYDAKKREHKALVQGVRGYWLSANGKKLLTREGQQTWQLRELEKGPEAKPSSLSLSGMKAKIDPPAEWAQIFREAWRYQRDYFYVKNVHGLDLDWAYKTYAPWVADVRHRADLNYLLDLLGGETAVGHSFVGGGDLPDVGRVPIGMLGADIIASGAHYQIKKIYRGENWNPNLQAPLSGPGIDMVEGAYLLAVNGVPINPDQNFYSYFEQLAGKQVELTVNQKGQLEGARKITVTLIANEVALRQRDWMESRRQMVDELSDGRLAYVWLPNTGQGGYQNFNRYYFAQQDRQGAIIDERFNQGGFAADYIVDLLSRELMGYFNNPVGDKQPFTSPGAGIWGPKVMIVNDQAGSGGDYLPYMFRKKKIGPLVGTRTWGGLVGIWDVPSLIDGGGMTAPRGGFFTTEGEWKIENEGVAPDYEVEQTPLLVSQGRDPQLERAVAVALELLAQNQPKLLRQPADPVRSLRPKR